MDDPAFQIETDLQTQSLLLAAANHDVSALRNLLRNSSANVQDEETGFTPLHAAVAAFEPDRDEFVDKSNGQTNGNDKDEAEEKQRQIEAAIKTIKLLFENGAIWNDLDQNNETPGCIAHRLGLKQLYDLFVDAGVRAEMLLSRLDQYQPLGGSDSEDDDDDDDEGRHAEEATEDIEVLDINEGGPHIEEATGDIEILDINAGHPNGDESTVNSNYLASALTFNRRNLVDEAGNGVMMEWESGIMRRSAELLVTASGLRVLNVGHGMGIIDGMFQAKQPKSHHIIEGHPNVLKNMKDQGWYEKPGVVVHAGRWQDVLPGLLEQNQMFDAIYFDTFAEEYKELREFFSEYVIGLLDPHGGPEGRGGKFGFFCGMGADRQVAYDVYNKIVEFDLFDAGFDTEWETIPVPDLDEQGEWEGLRRKYWVLSNYRLPTCSFIG